MTRTDGRNFLFLSLLLRFDPRRARRTDGRTDGVVGRIGARASKQRLAFLQSHSYPIPLGSLSGDKKKLGHQKIESPLNMRNLQGRLCLPRTHPTWPPDFKTGHPSLPPDDGMGHLKFWRGSPFVRPFRSEDGAGGMMRAEEERRGERRTRDPENGQSWGSRKREEEKGSGKEGRKATVKIF